MRIGDAIKKGIPLSADFSDIISIEQIKIFSNNSYNEVEKEVNSFLAENSESMVVVDIKFQNVHTSGNYTRTTVMVIYKRIEGNNGD